jgi:hypothetical protein
MSLVPLNRLLPYSFRQIDLASRYDEGRWKQSMRYLAAILITLLLATPAMSVELFRYRGAAMDGGTLEYIFETDEQDVPKTVSKEKAAEIAADFVTAFYHAQIGALETQEFRTTPVPFGSSAFRTRLKPQSSICFSSYCCRMGPLSRAYRRDCKSKRLI